MRRLIVAGIVGSAMTLAAAPASACRGFSDAGLWLDGIPSDLQPGEVVLEVSRKPGEKRKYPPYTGVISGTGIYRATVLRVLSGSFDGEEVIILPEGCVVWQKNAPGGGNVGILAGFVSPSEPWWDDSPALVARDKNWPRRIARAAAVRERANAGDLAAYALLYYATMNPKERKQILPDVLQKLRLATLRGEPDAREWLHEFHRSCCYGLPDSLRPPRASYNERD